MKTLIYLNPNGYTDYLKTGDVYIGEDDIDYNMYVIHLKNRKLFFDKRRFELVNFNHYIVILNK